MIIRELIVPILRDVIKERLLNRPRSAEPMTNQEVEGMITVAVNRMESDPVIQNETNQEPWYRSRVQLGLLMGAVATIFGIFGFTLPDWFGPNLVDAFVGFTALGGIGYAWWARRSTVAKPPLGISATETVEPPTA